MLKKYGPGKGEALSFLSVNKLFLIYQVHCLDYAKFQ